MGDNGTRGFNSRGRGRGNRRYVNHTDSFSSETNKPANSTHNSQSEFTVTVRQDARNASPRSSSTQEKHRPRNNTNELSNNTQFHQHQHNSKFTSKVLLPTPLDNQHQHQHSTNAHPHSHSSFDHRKFHAGNTNSHQPLIPSTPTTAPLHKEDENILKQRIAFLEAQLGSLTTQFDSFKQEMNQKVTKLTQELEETRRGSVQTITKQVEEQLLEHSTLRTNLLATEADALEARQKLAVALNQNKELRASLAKLEK